MLKDFLAAWQKFWFQEQSPAPMAIFRILLGLFTLQMSLMELLPNFLCFFGIKGMVDTATVSTRWWQQAPVFNIFLLLPQLDTYRFIFFWIFVLFAFFLTIGLYTRFSTLIVFLGLLSFHRQCPFVLDGGDDFMRISCFLLLFSSAGELYSVDRWLKSKKNYYTHSESKPPESLNVKLPTPMISPWAQRMIQVQISIAYLYAFLWKIIGSQWQEGTAVYYASRLIDFARFHLPLVDYPIVYQFLTYYTLFVELAMATLVWYRPWRYWILLSAFLFHAGIDISMNLPAFEWLFVSSYITFVDPADIEKIIRTGKNLFKDFLSKVRSGILPANIFVIKIPSKLSELCDRLIGLFALPFNWRTDNTFAFLRVLVALVLILSIGAYVAGPLRARFALIEQGHDYDQRLQKTRNRWLTFLFKEHALSDNDEKKLSAQEALATVFSLQQRYPEAVAILRRVCAKRSESNEPYNAKLVRALSTLADLYLETGHLEACRLCYETILNYDRSHLKYGQSRLNIDLNNLAVVDYFYALNSHNQSERITNLLHADALFSQALNEISKLKKTNASQSFNLDQADIFANKYLVLQDLGHPDEAAQAKSEANRLGSSQLKVTMP